MLLHILYLVGITAEAMTGALAAGRRRMENIGVIIIATATAIGGGSVRDILLGHYPLGWVKHRTCDYRRYRRSTDHYRCSCNASPAKASSVLDALGLLVFLIIAHRLH